MVKRITSFIGKEISNLHQAAYVLASFTLVAQILSFFRGRLLAGEFGASLELDIYYAAFRIPDMMFVIMTAIVSVWILVPYIIKLKERSIEEANDLVSSVFTMFITGAFIILTIIVIFMPQILGLLFPKFIASSLGSDFILMTRIMCLSPFILGISSFIGSIIQSEKKFVIYAMTPVFYNIGTILGIIYLYPMFGFKGLAFGVVLGSLMHLFIQIPTFLKSDIVPKIRFKRISNDVKGLLKISIPRTIDSISIQFNMSIIIAIAGLMAAGAVSVFSLSMALQAVIISLIGSSYTLAAFPAMSKSYSKGNISDMIVHFTTAARHIIFWTIPASVIFIVLRAQIVRTIFGTGNFDWNDTRLVAASLAIFSLSMLSQSLNMLFTRGFYAASKAWKPLIVGLVSTLVIPIFAILYLYIFDNSIINLGILESILRVEGVDNANILLLPLAMVTGSFIQMIMSYIFFVKEFAPIFKKLRRVIGHSLAASLVMGGVSYFTLESLKFLEESDTALGIFIQGLLAGLIGLASWIIVLVLLNNKEIKAVWKTMHTKIWKSKPLVEVDNSME